MCIRDRASVTQAIPIIYDAQGPLATAPSTPGPLTEQQEQQQQSGAAGATPSRGAAC